MRESRPGSIQKLGASGDFKTAGDSSPALSSVLDPEKDAERWIEPSGIPHGTVLVDWYDYGESPTPFSAHRTDVLQRILKTPRTGHQRERTLQHS